MKYIVFGSHKGLGFELVQSLLCQDFTDCVWGLSRKDQGLSNNKYMFTPMDFTKCFDEETKFNPLVQDILSFQPDFLFYCAGGGPYGSLEDHKWKDHEWAIKLNFLFPAKLIWALNINSLQAEFYYIGSQIAESQKGDPQGPSYASGKWAMKGLIYSLKNSKKTLYGMNCHIFSPGYMDTDLLPKNSQPRREGTNIASPQKVAQELLKRAFLNDMKRK